MFKNISWTNYWEFVLITLLIYYAIIICLYYLDDVKQAFSGKSTMLLKLNIFNRFNNSGGNIHSKRTKEEELLVFVHDYINEAKQRIDYAAENNIIKEELLYSLQQLSKKYPGIRGTPFQNFINNFILTEAANYSSIHLHEEDINVLWANNE